MELPAFTRKADFGVVILKDWMTNPHTGLGVNTVAGQLELVTAKEGFGFQPKGNETNWAVRVGTNQKSVLILGCQIRAVYVGQSFEENPANGWRL